MGLDFAIPGVIMLSVFVLTNRKDKYGILIAFLLAVYSFAAYLLSLNVSLVEAFIITVFQIPTGASVLAVYGLRMKKRSSVNRLDFLKFLALGMIVITIPYYSFYYDRYTNLYVHGAGLFGTILLIYDRINTNFHKLKKRTFTIIFSIMTVTIVALFLYSYEKKVEADQNFKEAMRKRDSILIQIDSIRSLKEKLKDIEEGSNEVNR